MFKCRDCGYIFEEPKHYSEDRTPGGVFEGGSFIEHYTGCPLCAGAYDEAIECDSCNEFFFREQLESNENGSFCFMCYQENYPEEDLDEKC